MFYHFENALGPMEENPDPVPGTLTEKEAESRIKRRRKPKERCHDVAGEPSKKAKEDMTNIAEKSF